MPGKPASALPRAALAAGQGGVALAIVVWFIAGMSLLVAGIVAQARVDNHMAQNHLGRAVAVAAGDGAIQLMMADMVLANDPKSRSRGEPPDGRYRVGEMETRVTLVSTSGLIDVNSASEKMLSALFESAGGAAADDARSLAQNVVQSRSPGTVNGLPDSGVKLNAVEDLLRVPGFSRTLLDSVRDFIVVGEAAQGATNWARAPEALLSVLGRSNPAREEAVRARRGAAGDQSGQLLGAFRVDAIVLVGDKIWLRRRWISMRGDSSSALPWRVLRTEPPRVLMKDSMLLGGSVDA